MILRTTIAAISALALASSPLLASAQTVGVNAHVAVGTSTGATARMGANASTTAHAGANLDARIVQAKDRADKEIDRRIDKLTELAARISEMKRLTDADHSALSASIQAEIDSLTALKVKIDADTSTTTLKADIQSITKGYRIFVLVMPQAAITAAADRILVVVDLMEQFSAKLETRINEATTSATTSLEASLADYDTKVASAQAQAQAAIDSIKGLVPDNGDQTVFQSNLAVLKAARAKVQAAHQDLVAARKDAGLIVKGLGGGSQAFLHASTEASTSAAR
jgi:hypothetical protein